MRKLFLLLIPAMFFVSSCADRNSGDVFAQLQHELRFDRDAQFIYLYGSVLRALVKKAQDPALLSLTEGVNLEADGLDSLAGDAFSTSGLESMTGMMDNMERVRIFRATDWEDEREDECRERIYTALESQGNELLMGTSIKGGELTMFIHDENEEIDRFQLLIRMPAGGEPLEGESNTMLGDLVGNWTSEKALIFAEVTGRFDKDQLGRMLMQLNTSLTE